MGNIRTLQREGDKNTEGRTSIRDILTTPQPPSTPSAVSSASTLVGIANRDPLELFLAPGNALDAGRPRRTRGRGSNAILVARNIFRVGGGLQQMAGRAGRSIRRVFRGAVHRVTGGGGVFRQTQVGSATLDRPAEQQVGGGRNSIVELQMAMASVGLVIPEWMALEQRRPRLRRRASRDNWRG